MKKFNRKHLSTLTLAASLLSVSQAIYSHQPATVVWKISDSNGSTGNAQAGDSSGGDSNLYVELKFWDQSQKKPLLILFPNCGQDPAISGQPLKNLDDVLKGRSPLYDSTWIAPGPRWRACAQEDSFLIPDSTSNKIVRIDVDFLRFETGGLSPQVDFDVYEISDSDIRAQLSVAELARKYRNTQPSAHIPISAHYRLDSKGGWQLGKYTDVYGVGYPVYSPRTGVPRGVKGSSDYAKIAPIMPVNLDSFRRSLSIPKITKYQDPATNIRTLLADVKKQGIGMEGDQICYSETQPQVKALEGISLKTNAPVSHTLSGRFSTKWTTDHSLHSGFGFMVEAWRVSPATKLGSAWVETDGSWTMGVPASLGFTGGNIRINYLSYNSYYAPQNQDGNKYWWSDLWTVSSNTFTTGHRYVDSDGGTYNGLGELVDTAMTMWSRLYWDAGINPVPTSPIKFFYPNTWDNCGGSSPWSCATFAGDQIWLIAEHGTQGDVVNHEMGHALQSKFWGGKRAAGSGGSHSLDGCYPTRLGLALGEGFANFMAAWVGYPTRNGADGSFGSGLWSMGFDPEQRTAPPSCSNGWENETWVARTFWDLHDTHSDGSDILWFNHPGAVISLFLGNAVTNDNDARDMRYYRNIYKNAASAGHASFVNDIFNQNRQ